VRSRGHSSRVHREFIAESSTPGRIHSWRGYSAALSVGVVLSRPRPRLHFGPRTGIQAGASLVRDSRRWVSSWISVACACSVCAACLTCPYRADKFSAYALMLASSWSMTLHPSEWKKGISEVRVELSTVASCSHDKHRVGSRRGERSFRGLPACRGGLSAGAVIRVPLRFPLLENPAGGSLGSV
jgi:hypothetical protein